MLTALIVTCSEFMASEIMMPRREGSGRVSLFALSHCEFSGMKPTGIPQVYRFTSFLWFSYK